MLIRYIMEPLWVSFFFFLRWIVIIWSICVLYQIFGCVSGLLRDCKLSFGVSYSKTLIRGTITRFGADSALIHIRSCLFFFAMVTLGLIYDDNESLIIRVLFIAGLVFFCGYWMLGLVNPSCVYGRLFISTCMVRTIMSYFDGLIGLLFDAAVNRYGMMTWVLGARIPYLVLIGSTAWFTCSLVYFMVVKLCAYIFMNLTRIYWVGEWFKVSFGWFGKFRFYVYVRRVLVLLNHMEFDVKFYGDYVFELWCFTTMVSTTSWYCKCPLGLR